jgi:Na+:H+ antiporter, NhaA family
VSREAWSAPIGATLEAHLSTGKPLWKHSWLSSDGPVPRLIARPLRTFLDTEAAGGIVLLTAALAALVWVNSPVGESYESLWGIELRLSVGALVWAEDLRHVVNDGLMTLFFFVVGLEIKRELVAGELNNLRRAALPALAAVGGMVVPAGLYLAFNLDGPAASGWGIPMATDIAFAVGVLALMSDRIPPGLKVFLVSLAIVDDIGAVLVIALFYTEGIHIGWLVAGIGVLALIAVLRGMRVLWIPVYVVLGSVVWLATFESGVHATIAGVALGLLTPARPTDPGGLQDVVDNVWAMPDEPDAQSLRATTLQAREVVSIAERLEQVLHPWTSFVIVPLFALANAGLDLSVQSLRDAAASSVTVGIVVGLVVGKTVGIAAMSWFALRLGVGEAPEGVGWGHLVGGAAVAGIGFTVSLFITDLAFTDADLTAEAKMGVLSGSVVAGLTGAVILLGGRRRRPAVPGCRERTAVPGGNSD